MLFFACFAFLAVGEALYPFKSSKTISPLFIRLRTEVCAPYKLEMDILLPGNLLIPDNSGFSGDVRLLKRKVPRSIWNTGLSCDVIFVLCVFDARLGDINFERVIGQGIGVEHADRLICLSLCGHGHKREALRQAGSLVFDEFHRSDHSGCCEQGIDFVLCGRLSQVSYVNSYIHFITAFSGTAGNKNDRDPYKRVGGQGTTEIQLLITLSV